MDAATGKDCVPMAAGGVMKASESEQGAAFIGQQVVRLGVCTHVGREHRTLRNDAKAALARGGQARQHQLKRWSWVFPGQ